MIAENLKNTWNLLSLKVVAYAKNIKKSFSSIGINAADSESKL